MPHLTLSLSCSRVPAHEPTDQHKASISWGRKPVICTQRHHIITDRHAAYMQSRMQAWSLISMSARTNCEGMFVYSGVKRESMTALQKTLERISIHFFTSIFLNCFPDSFVMCYYCQKVTLLIPKAVFNNRPYSKKEAAVRVVFQCKVTNVHSKSS